jgi:hypothetical protein
VAEIRCQEPLRSYLYYRWSKEFLEAGKKRLAGDTTREATTNEVKELRSEARHPPPELPRGWLVIRSTLTGPTGLAEMIKFLAANRKTS